jgi:hypothetical protein
VRPEGVGCVRKLLALAAVLTLVAGCSGSADRDDARQGSDDGRGLVATDDWRARQDDYLTFATTELRPGSPYSILAHVERADRDPSFTWNPGEPTVEDFVPMFEKLQRFADTSDFDVNRLLFLWYRARDQLDQELVDAIGERLLAFKYWQTEPTPDGIVDDQYYWTENHQIIFLADEYIAGQAFPDREFTNSGMTGREHMEHAEPLIRRWIDLRSRFGWSEWLSNVYYMEDLMGLVLLAEHSDDEELATLASMAIDLLLFEIASHTQDGAFGATHGRSYKKDKMTALDEDNFNLSKMLFDDTDHPYQGVDNAMLLAMARRYRPPEVVRRVATSDEVSIDRSRMSIPLDPLAPVEPDPKGPYGLDYDDPDNAMVWWGIGGQFAWQVVPLTVQMMQGYELWEGELYRRAADFRPIVESSTIPELRDLAHSLAPMLNAGLLSEVNTYTWRSPEVMLSTAQDWLPGLNSEQVHTWQATIDPNAQVFTNHPAEPLDEDLDWHTNSRYWTGTATNPRALQFENVGISIYQPTYEPGALPGFDYQPFTHAYFPQDHFDEVVERDGWTIGRKGDGYIGLWSKRPTSWLEYDSSRFATRGMTEPFDLIAEGGPDNVWIVEVGRAPEWASFDVFVDAITGADVEVGDDLSGVYVSPTRGEVRFGLDGPFEVDGAEVTLADYPRYDNPWAEVAFDSRQYRIEADGWVLELDFDTVTRRTSAPA